MLPRIQINLWAALMILAVISYFQIHVMLGFVLLLMAQLLPRISRSKGERLKDEGDENQTS